MAAEVFKGLPMRELIGAPLQAACESQQKLAESALDYMLRIGFEEGDLKNARLIKFNLERPVETPDGVTTSTIEVQAPFLGLVPIPSLLIESVDVDFQMEVTSTETSKDTTTAEITSKAGYKGLFSRVSVEVQGRVTTSRPATPAPSPSCGAVTSAWPASSSWRPWPSRASATPGARATS